MNAWPKGVASKVSESDQSIHVFTSAATNYLPKVRVLCESLKRHHPDLVVHLALADRRPKWLDAAREPFDTIIEIEELGIPKTNAWVFKHSLIELSTAIKPFVAKRLLLQGDCKAVIYFDPDMVLFSPNDDLISEFESASILLTPHLTEPEPTQEGVRDNEMAALKHGVFNLGFIGIRNDDEGIGFANWWADRLYDFCLEALPEGLWVDQKWLNLAPCFFNSVRIIRNLRFNVAAWNIATRQITGDMHSGFYVNGSPLGFYHFSGFDTGAHQNMLRKYGGRNPSLQSLVRWYSRSIQADQRASKTPWGYSLFSNGDRITRAHRLIYRLREDLQFAYPQPFQVTKQGPCYLRWFEGQAGVEHPEILNEASHSSFAHAISQSEMERRLLIHQQLINWVRHPMAPVSLIAKAWQVLRVEGFHSLESRLQ